MNQYLAQPFCCQGEVYILSFSMHILQIFILYFSMYIFTMYTVCACLILTHYLGGIINLFSPHIDARQTFLSRLHPWRNINCVCNYISFCFCCVHIMVSIVLHSRSNIPTCCSVCSPILSDIRFFMDENFDTNWGKQSLIVIK